MLKIREFTKSGLKIMTSGLVAAALFGAPAAFANTFLTAAVEFNPKLHDRDGNLEALAVDIERALKHGARLVVAPEMALTGYLYTDRNDIAPYVDTIPGKATARLGKLTAAYNAYVVIGMPEKDETTGIFYNAAVLVGPKGVIGKYRKVHQWEAEEHWAAWGDLEFPVFETELGRIAINICMDSGYFESSRIPAIKGADIIAFPTNSSIQAIYYNQARALQNGVYVVGANRNTTEKDFHMVGMSAIWGPDGDRLAEAPYVAKDQAAPTETSIIYATIDTDRYKKREQRLAGRRPELYQPLMLKVAPWDYTTDKKERELRAIALQYEPTSGDKRRNLDFIKAQLGDKVSADLVVLPEYSLTAEGTGITPAMAHQWAEPIDGDTFKEMSELASARNVNIVYSQIERDGDRFYVTAVVIGKDGKRIGSYRKTHLSAQEKEWATAGDQFPVFNIPEFGKLGILSGEDVLYPEAAGILSGARADVIAIPSSWKGIDDYGAYMAVNQGPIANKYPDHTMVLWDAVAYTAQAYTIVANFVGSEAGYAGESALYTLDPLYGLDQAAIEQTHKGNAFEVKFKTKQNDWWLNQFNVIASRRTDAYKPLILPLSEIGR